MNWAYVAGTALAAIVVILWALYQDFKLDRRLRIRDNAKAKRHLRIVRK